MSDENNAPELTNTPIGETYDGTISTGETEPQEAPFSVDDLSIKGGFTASGEGDISLGTQSGEALKDLTGYVTRFDDLENAYASAAIEQGFWGAMGNGLARASTEVVGGTLEGLGALAGIFDKERMNHENFLEELGRNIRESTDDFDIWERNQGASFQFSDAAWWAKNLPSMASALSMLIPGVAVARGVSYLGKGARFLAKAGKASQKTKNAIAVGENVLQQVGGGFGMRHAENMREAHGVFEDVRREVLENPQPLASYEGTDAMAAFVGDNNREPINTQELADYIAGAAAKRSYAINSGNLIFDIAQFSAFGKAFRATRGLATKATTEAAKAGAKEAAKKGAKGMLSRFTEKALPFVALDMGTEGIEEMVNHIGSEEGKYHGLRMANLNQESTLQERLAMYQNDDHLWEAAFFGAIGGGLFTGGKAGVDKIKGKGTKQQERILEQARHRQDTMKQAVDIAKKAESGEATPEQTRMSIADMMFQAAMNASENGTADMFESEVDAVAKQMEEEGVPADKIEEFRSDAMEGLAVAEAAVAEANKIMATMPEMSASGRALYRSELASVALDVNRAKLRRESIAARTEGITNKEEQRAQALREFKQEIDAIIDSKNADPKAKAEAESLKPIVDRMVSELPETTELEGNMEQLETLKSELSELRAKRAEMRVPQNATKEELAAVKKVADAIKAKEAEIAELEKAGKREDVTVDDLIYEDLSLEVEEQALAERKRFLMSNEGVEATQKVADAFDEAQKKKEEEQNKPSDMNDAELKSQLKKAKADGDTDRVAELESEMEQRELERKNKNASKLEQRSKDIEVGPIAQGAIDKMVADTQNLEGVNEDGTVATDGNFKYYRDKRTGKLYMRTTTFIAGGNPDTFGGTEGMAAASSAIGNSVDAFVRDYFDGNLKAEKEYPNLTAEMQQKLKNELVALEEQFLANGEKVVPHDVTLMTDTEVATEMDGEVAGIAGTVDLITVDKDGNLRIYDMKTMKDATLRERISVKQNLTLGTVTAEYGKGDRGYKGGPTYRQKHQKQLSVYRLMAQMSTGLPVVDLGIIPIETTYEGDPNKMSAEEARKMQAETRLLPVIPHEPLDNVNGLEMPEEQPIEPDPDPTPEGDKDAEPNDVEPGDQTEPTEVDAGSFSFPLTGLLDYFAGRLQVSKDWNRDNLLVHSYNGPLTITDAAVLERYNLVQKALMPRSGAVVRFEVRGTAAVERTSFKTFQKKGAVQEIVGDPSVTKGKAAGVYEYTPSPSDSLQIVMTIDGVEIGAVPTVAELLNAASDRFEANGKQQYAERRFGKESRLKGVRPSENMMMSEATQEAHFENALVMQRLRNAILENAGSASGAVGTQVRVKAVAGRTTLGARAYGSLILDSSMQLTAESTDSSGVVIENGIALALPGTGDGMVVQAMGEGKNIVTPYQSNEQAGGSAANMGWYSSGALFAPLEHNGEILWVKVPGQQMNMLVNGEQIIDAVSELLRTGEDANIAKAQNIVGSNAVRKTEDGWAIYPTNINGGIVPDAPPLTELIDGVWTNPLKPIVSAMNLDIAIDVVEGESAFKSGGLLDLTPEGQSEGMSWPTLAHFVASEVRLGYAPVTNTNGEVQGWTHPLAPVYSRNDSNPNNEKQYEGKLLFNENTNATQLRMQMTPEVIEGQLSGKSLLEGLTPEEENEVVTESQQKQRSDGRIVVDGAKTAEEMWEALLNSDLAKQGLNAVKRKNEANKNNRRRYFSVERAEAAANGERATALDRKQAEEWWAANVPNVPFKRVAGIITRGGTTAYGIFEAGAVAVSDLALKGTEYHEAFHAVFHLYLTPERQAKVMAEARAKFGKDLTEEQLEEELAEEFREYMLTNGLSMKEKSTIRRFFSELLELIRSIMGGRRVANRLFRDINRGTFANMTPKTNEFATRYMRAVNGIPEYNAQVQEELIAVLRKHAFDAFRYGDVHQYAGFETFKAETATTLRQMREQGIIFGDQTKEFAITRSLLNVVFNGPLLEEVRNSMLVMPADSRARVNLMELMTKNREAVIDHFANDAGFQNYVRMLVANESTAGTNETEQYDENRFARMNPKDSLTQTVRDLVESTPQVTRQTLDARGPIKAAMVAAESAMMEAAAAKKAGNTTQLEMAQEKLNNALDLVHELVGKEEHVSFFGLPRGMNVDLNFPFMSERLASATSLEDMVGRLMEMGKIYPEFQLLAMNLQNAPQDVQAAFVAGFRRTGTAEVQVNKFGQATLSDVFTGTLTQHNMSTIAAQMVGKDAKKLRESIKKLRSMEDNLDLEQLSGQVVKMLQYMGFSTIDPAALEVTVLDIVGNPKQYNNMMNRVEMVLVAYDRVSRSTEEGEGDASRAYRQAIGNLADYFAANDRGAVSSTLKNVEGTRIFSKQVPAFIGRWFDNFVQQPAESDAQFEQRLRNTIFADPRMMATTYGLLVFPNGKFDIKAARRMNTYRVGGHLQGEGSPYSKMTNEEWIRFQVASMLGLQANGKSVGSYMPVTTLSDAGNSYMVPAMLIDPTNTAGRIKALTILSKVIKAELTEMRHRPGRFSNPKVDAYMRSQFKATNTDGMRWMIGTTAELNGEVETAAEILFDELMAEAELMREDRDFTDAIENMPKAYSNVDFYTLPARLVFTGFLSNFSTSVALAGTANEFKNGETKNTVDMQKRHKHIASPSVANAGVSSKTTFKSVTMKDVPFDLTTNPDGTKNELEKRTNVDGSNDYTNVEIADAQSYVTVEMYEAILLEHGDMSPDLEAAFEKLRNNEPLTASEKGKLMRPYKPFYYERVMDKDGMLRSHQIKNSIIPLVPGISEDFDKLHDWMMDNEVDQVQMGTAHKVGQHKPNVELLNKDGRFEVVNFDKDTMVYDLPMSGYGKQVHVKDHWHDDSTNKMMSQMERISIAAAVLHMGEEGLAIRDEFMEVLDDLYKEQAQELFAKFGEDGGFNAEMFAEWLEQEVAGEGTPQYVLDAIRRHEFTSPTVIGMLRTRVFSGVENQAKQMRVLGGTQVQISSQFFRNRENRLKGQRLENGKVMPAQIVVSRDFLPKEMRSMSIEEIKAKNPQALEMFTVRIPSESPNSGSLVEVVDFLPEGMDGAIVPDEFVTQMGSDFDVDKLVFQFRDLKNPESKQNRLYELMTAPFRDARVLPYIQAPQGFQTLAEIAGRRGLRSAELTKHINENPYSVMTHNMLRSDNMAGVALKGQAANKNLILLDFIRNGFVFETNFQINGNNIGFNYKSVSESTIRLHSEMVAAAMDGAKDPVYGKLGVNNSNFGMFSTLLLLTNGNLETATDIIQSRPAQLMANGSIVVRGSGKHTTVIARNNEGMKFVKSIASAMNITPSKDEMEVRLPPNRNLFAGQPGNAKAEALLVSALGQFKAMVMNPLTLQGDAMRIDRGSIAKKVEKITLQDMSEFQMAEDSPVITTLQYRTKGGEIVNNPFKLETKGTILQMFDDVMTTLGNAGDQYLAVRNAYKGMNTTAALTFAAYDFAVRAKAAEAGYAMEKVYTHMGERDTYTVKSMPEQKEQWSLEMWLRHFRANPKMLSENQDLATVVSKLLVQPAPYKMDGVFYDNITLANVNDDMEAVAVQKAVNNLFESDNTDFQLFADAMMGYEAQRSRYGMSQSRLTRVLPDALHEEIAELSGAKGETDGQLAGHQTNAVIDILKYQAHNPNLPWIVADALYVAEQRAMENKSNRGPKQVVVDGKLYVLLPTSENEQGETEYRVVDSPNNGQNFAGKPVPEIFESWEIDELGEEADGQESRLAYGRDLDPTEKIAFLEERFRKAGVPVTVKFDSSLPANGRVVIDKKTATVTLNPEMLQGDTVAHEFGHILTEALGINDPLVQQAIFDLRGTELWQEVSDAYPELQGDRLAMEVLTTALGREATDVWEESKKNNRLRTIMNRLFRAIGKLFGIQPKATRQLAEMLMGQEQMGPLSLNGIPTTEMFQKAGKKRTGSEVTKDFVTKWNDLAHQLKTRSYTNTEFEVAAARLKTQHDLVKRKKNVGTKLEAIAQVAQAELLNASSVTSTLADRTANGFTSVKLSAKEAVALTEAHNALQSLETLRQVIEGMDPEGGGSAKVRESYEALQEQLDRIITAERVLKEQVAMTVSQQLVNNSTDPKIKKFVEEEGNLIFDMINDPELRGKMTDVTAVTKGTLGVKEFRNPVVQLIAKQLANSTEAARLEGRQAEQRISGILKKAAAAGVKVSDLVDMETGKFITETNQDYIEQARAARVALHAGNEAEWLKFHAKNSEMMETTEYFTGYKYATISLRKKEEEVRELRQARKLYGLKSYDAAIEAAEAELTAMYEKQEALVTEYHDFEVSDTFEAARAKEEEKGEDALRKFDNEHGVVNGVPLNQYSRFVTRTVAAEYVNDNYTGKGEPVPMAKHKNSKFDKLSPAAKEALTDIRKEMKDALGADSKFLQEGDVPKYTVAADKSMSLTEMFGRGKKDLAKRAKALTDKDYTLKASERVLEDAAGNAIYTRDRKMGIAKPEDLQGLDMEQFGKVLGQAAKDAHMESAKQTVEPFAYLSRDVFNQTEVIDGKHVIMTGPKGKRARQWRTRKVEGTNISVALDQWLEGMLGENWKDPSALDGVADTFQTYTSLMGVGLNLPAWFNNFAYGNIQRMMEMKGENYYSKENGKRAIAELSTELVGIANDLVSGKRAGYSSRTSAIVNLLDIADDQREMPFGKRESKTSKAFNLAFIGQTMGEVWMQNQTAFAMMMEQEVTLSDGTKTNLYDAMVFDEESGTVSLPKGATATRNGQQVELNNEFLAAFRNKAKSINHYIHGAYNQQDAGTWQRQAWGRMAMQFRRWLPMGIKKRFAGEQYNESRERLEQGWYVSMLQFLNHLRKEGKGLKDMGAAIKQLKEDSPMVYNGAMRAFIEAGSGILGFLMLVALYAALDEEDEENYFVGLALNRAQRLMQEQNTYLPWGMYDTFRQFGENPLAAVTRLDGFTTIIAQGIEDGAGFVIKGEGLERYASGYRKGDSKLLTALSKATPGISQLDRLRNVGETQKQFSLAKNTADWFEK